MTNWTQKHDGAYTLQRKEEAEAREGIPALGLSAHQVRPQSLRGEGQNYLNYSYLISALSSWPHYCQLIMASLADRSLCLPVYSQIGFCLPLSV